MDRTDINRTVNIRDSIEEIRKLPETEGVRHACRLRIAEEGEVCYLTDAATNARYAAYDAAGVYPIVHLPSGAVPARVADFLTDNLVLVLIVAEGMDIDWDARTPRLTLIPEAANALEKLNELVREELLYENGDYIAPCAAHEWLYDMERELGAAETLEAAEALAAEAVMKGEVMYDPYEDGSARFIIDLDEALEYARETWHDYHELD